MRQTILTVIIVALATLSAIAQTASENYVYTTSYQVPTQDGQVDDQDKIENVTYYDGLGRPKQSIGIGQTPTQKDIVTHIEYDAFGRQTREYLPVPVGDGQLGTFRNIDMPSEINSYYTSNFGNDIDPNAPNPYSEKLFEASPLNRVLKQAAPGKDWAMGNNHEISFNYQTNTSSDQVALFRVTFSPPSNTEVPLISRDGDYSPSQLYKTITYDENYNSSVSLKNHTTEEFKDKQGRVILKRTYNNGEPHDTYYVYDDFGNLTFVFPPKLSQLIGTSSFNPSIDGLGYQYRYDYRNRLIEKKIPGKDWEYIVYNRLDQPVLTQDTNLRSQNKWLFTKYDAFGRIIYTGIIVEQQGRQALQGHANNSYYDNYEVKTTATTTLAGTALYYSNEAFPLSGFVEIHTVNYYDDYDFDTAGITVPESINGVALSDKTKSLATGSKIRVLGTNNWITSLTYYDKKGRPIYTATKNEYLNTEDHTASTLDFTGKVLETQSIHNKVNQDQVNIQNEYTYDHTGRPQLTKQRTNKLIYDDLTGFQKEGNTLTKTAGASWYNNNITSSNQIVGDGYATWTFDRSNPRAFIGFSNQDNGSSHKTIQYSIYAYIDRVLIAEGNGTSYQWKFSGTSSNGGGFKAGDELMMKRKNGIISYYKNGALLYTSQTPNYAPLIVDGSIYPTGVKVINLTLYNDTQELISKNVYDELGQLVKKDVGNDETTPLQQVDYSYNIRGWLRSINNRQQGLGEDLFAFDIHYNEPINNRADPLYNGNISVIDWQSANNTQDFTYRYTYDALNRLKKALFTGGIYYNRYSLDNVDYDKNGNIQSLKRIGHTIANPNPANNNHFGVMDDLTYTYDTGNKLLSVNDVASSQGFNDGNSTGNDYTYDDNGNLTSDANKGITSILWNHINLPTNIAINNSTHNGNIEYVYSANGIKIRKIVNDNGNVSTTDYAGAYQYVNNDLKFIRNIEDGYVYKKADGSFGYAYYYTDQLDNIRLLYTDANGDGVVTTNEIIKEQHFYPFGMKLKGFNSVVNPIGSSFHKYDYQNQERQDELGLNWLQFKYRMHDPAIGRFVSIDPLAMEYPHNSTYAFAENKVIKFNELEGLEVYFNKFDRLSYENQNAQGKVGTFVVNSGISLVNGLIDVWNYAGDLTDPDAPLTGMSYGANKLASDTKATAGAIADYAQNTTLSEFGSDVGDALSKVETYENITGGLFGAKGLDKLSKLKFGTINGSTSFTATALKATQGKTTTILGRLTDTRALGETLDNVKSGMNEGGFNILKQPDKYWSIDTNMKWLQRAIDRGDVIKAASDPTDLKNIYRNGVDGKKTVYGQEVDYLNSKGYTYDPDTQSFIQQ